MVSQIKRLDLLSRPRSSAKKLEARLDALVEPEAAHVNMIRQIIPPSAFNQVFEDRFQRNSMQWIIGLLFAHYIVVLSKVLVTHAVKTIDKPR